MTKVKIQRVKGSINECSLCNRCIRIVIYITSQVFYHFEVGIPAIRREQLTYVLLPLFDFPKKRDSDRRFTLFNWLQLTVMEVVIHSNNRLGGFTEYLEIHLNFDQSKGTYTYNSRNKHYRTFALPNFFNKIF